MYKHERFHPYEKDRDRIIIFLGSYLKKAGKAVSG